MKEKKPTGSVVAMPFHLKRFSADSTSFKFSEKLSTLGRNDSKIITDPRYIMKRNPSKQK